jgi:hypothetical protein
MERERAELLVQQAVCGDLPAGDRELLEALRQFPDLGRSLAELGALKKSLDCDDGEAEALIEEARARILPGDRERIRDAAQAHRRRRWPAPLLLVAAVVVLAAGALLWPSLGGPATDRLPDGPLSGGSTSPLTFERRGAALVVHLGEPPRHGEYHLRLVASGPGGDVELTDTTHEPQWTLPDEWLRAVERADAAKLYAAMQDPSTGAPIVRTAILR